MTDYIRLITELNAVIWDAAELKFAETISAGAICRTMEQEGFAVTCPIGGMDTAFRAVFGSGKPVIGILAEFDALDGMSQQAGEAVYAPRPETTTGHGCGHSLLGTGSVAAALMVRDYLTENKKEGTVVLLGCPGEEGGSGKAYMARAGLFDELDIALTWHPGGGHAVMTGSLQANCQAYFRFKGIAAHAAAVPHLGRSALDAVELMDVGVNYMREHIEPTDRIHYAITDTGGISPNVVQPHAEVLYLIRSVNSEKVQALYKRVCKIAQAAAMMTETEVEILFDKGCSNVLSNPVLEELLYNSMNRVPLPVYTEEELARAARFKALFGEKELMSDLSLGGLPAAAKRRSAAMLRSCTLPDCVLPWQHLEVDIPGSSDVGDCSHCVPTAQFVGGCFVPGTPAHSWQATAQGKESYAVKATLWAAQVLADAGSKAIEEPALIEQAKEAFFEQSEGKPYNCPIPPEIMPHAGRPG